MLTIYLVSVGDMPDKKTFEAAKQICLDHGGCYVPRPLNTQRFGFPASYAFGEAEKVCQAEDAIREMLNKKKGK